MSDDIPLGSLPQWINSAKFNLNAGAAVPGGIAELVAGLRYALGLVDTGAAAAAAGKKAVIDKMKEYYNKGNDVKNGARDALVDAVNNFATDLSETGGKFIVATPFYGGLDTARALAVDYLNPRHRNFPNFGPDTYASSMTILFNMGSSLIPAIEFLLTLSFLWNGKSPKTVADISSMLNSPLFSPVARLIAGEDLVEVNEPSQLEAAFFDAVAGAELINNFTTSLTDGLKLEVSDLWDNSPLKDIQTAIADPTTATTALGTLIGNVANTRNLDPADIISAIPNPLETIANRATDEGGILTLPADPYDHWFNLLTLGDLFPGIKDLAGFVTSIASETSSIVDFAGNGILQGLEAAGAVADVVTGSVTELNNAAAGVLDKMEAGLNILPEAALFLIPSVKGGLETLRFIHSEWMYSGITNAPAYDNESLTFMVMIVFGTPIALNTGLTEAAKVFSINLMV